MLVQLCPTPLYRLDLGNIIGSLFLLDFGLAVPSARSGYYSYVQGPLDTLSYHIGELLKLLNTR